MKKISVFEAAAFLAAIFAVSGCLDVEGDPTVILPPGSLTGSVTIQWAGVMPAALPTVRASVDATDIETLTADFPAAAGTGTLNGIPIGSDRTVNLQALNGSNVVIFEGAATGNVITEGQTTDAGTIVMTQVSGVTAPADVTGFAAAAGSGQVNLAWINPVADFSGVRIMRRDDGSFPTSPLDGSLVYEGRVAFVDSAVVNGTAYFYTAFAYSTVPYFSAGAQDSATPTTPR